MKQECTEAFINDIIRMECADDISFNKIKKDRWLFEAEVIKIVRSNSKAGSLRLWCKRVSSRGAKHEKQAKLIKQEVE